MASSARSSEAEDREVAAYHEAGHAVAAHHLGERGDILNVSIFPTQTGYSGFIKLANIPETERNLPENADRVRARLTVMMAGRAAESLFKSATGISLYGMGGRIGAIAFSKDYEREADYYGLYLAAYANYDISDAPDFWRRFSPKAGSWSWTHPTHPERSARAMLVVVDVEHKKRDLRDLVPDKPPPLENTTIKASPRRD